MSWLQTADGIAPSRALEINSLSMAVLLPVMIAAGLVERPRRPQALSAAGVRSRLRRRAAAVLAVEPSHRRFLAQLGQLGLVLIVGLYGGTLPAVMVEAAPPPVRCTAVALGYNISFGVIGGLTPLAATWLVDRTGDEIAPAFLIMAAAAVTFLTLLRFRETYRSPFIGASSRAATAYA